MVYQVLLNLNKN